MAGKGLNFFDECVAVYICVHRKKRAPLLPEGTVKCTHSKFTDRQRTPIKINKNGAVTKVIILVERGILKGI